MAAVRHLEFGKISIFGHVTYICMLFAISIPNFHVNRPIRRRDIAKKRFSIWLPSAILNLKNVVFCQIAILGMEICIRIPNLIEIG